MINFGCRDAGLIPHDERNFRVSVAGSIVTFVEEATTLAMFPLHIAVSRTHGPVSYF